MTESTPSDHIPTGADASTAVARDITLPVVPAAGAVPGWFKGAVLASAAVVIGLAVFLSSTPWSPFTVRVGDVATLVAVMAALLACARATRRSGPYRRGWRLLTVGLAVWTAAQVLWTLDGFTVGHTSAQISLADIGFLGYSIPATAALLSFTRGASGLVTRVRGVVDALLIATSVFFISWAAVLGPALRENNAGWVSWAAGQVFPLVDAAVCSLVLFQALRQPAGRRLPWMLLGCGMVTLAATDTAFIAVSARDDLVELSAVFSAGWVAAWLLVALAAWAPARQTAIARVRFLTPAQELVPYFPVLIAIVCAAGVDVFHDPVLLVDGAAVLALLTARQVMIIAEKEALALELESRVESRTAELLHAQDDLRQTFENAPIGIMWTTLTGVIVRVNAVFCEMMGRSEDELIGSGDHQLRFASEMIPAGQIFPPPAAQIIESPASRVEQRYRHGDGREVWAEVSLFVTRDLSGAPKYIVGQFQDITARRAAARAESNQARFLQAVLENLDSGVVACDAEGNLTILNRALRELYSPLPLEAGSETWATHFDLFQPDGTTPLPAQDVPLIRALNGEQVHNAEFVMADNRGSKRTVIANGHSITDADGKLFGAVIAMHDITDRRAAEAALHRQALHDPLTDLANRALLRDRLEHAIARRTRQPEPLALLLLDLDGFKLVNDSLGHQAGDQVLRLLADRLRSCLRKDDTIARLGGDEFAVIMENTSEDEATSVAAQILHLIRQPVIVQGRPITSDASIGIMISTAADSPESLLRNADLAMYAAKDSGKGTIQVFTASMHETVLQRLTLEAELREAIADCQFSVAYQPIVSLLTGRLHGFEALVRWNHPHRGTIPPVTFIPRAEATGLILPLGQWVLREACRQTAAWRRTITGAQNLSLAVNISVRQLQDATFADMVADALTDSGLSTENLQLEITESIFEHRGQVVLAMLNRLHATGVHLVVDDFGTGYSSLSRLHSLPFDEVKIDKSFIDKLADGEPAPMVAATIAMAHSLGLRAVAEGVEATDQVPFLLLHHCDYVQGYLFGRPVSGAEMEILLERQGVGTRWRTGPSVPSGIPFAEAE